MPQGLAMHLWRSLLRALLAAAAATLLVWALVTGPRRYWPDAAECDDRTVLDRCFLEEIGVFWLTPAVAAAAALALLLSYQASPEGAAAAGGDGDGSCTAVIWSRRLRARAVPAVRRLAGWQLPPRHFWAWWCGGMSAADAAVVVVWAAIQAAWLAPTLLSRLHEAAGPATALPGSPAEHAQRQFDAVCKSLGTLLLPNLMLLLLPVSRGSILLQATGLTYPQAIRFHRWQGHAFLLIAALHSLGYWSLWWVQGRWAALALATSAGPTNNVAGGAAFLAGLALWLTSVAYVRRLWYDLFLKVHHVAFIVFTMGALNHYGHMFYYFLTPMLFYAVDVVVRLLQAAGAGRSRVLAAQASSPPEATTPAVVSLTIANPDFVPASSGFVWLRVPAVDRFQWKPFEYIAADLPDADGSGAAPPAAIHVHIKSYGRWTRRLADLVAEHGPEGLNRAGGVVLDGPYTDIEPFHQRAQAGRADGTAMFVGGIGAATAFNQLHELRAADASADPTLLVWTCRSMQELTFLAPKLVGLAERKNLHAQLRVYYTGSKQDLQQALEADGHVSAASAASGVAAASATAGAPLVLEVTPNTAWPPPCSRGTTNSLAPVIAGGGPRLQAVRKVMLHVLVFAGTLGAIIRRRTYGVLQLHGRVISGPPHGLQRFALLAAGSLVPGLVLLGGYLAARAAARRVRHCRHGRCLWGKRHWATASAGTGSCTLGVSGGGRQRVAAAQVGPARRQPSLAGAVAVRVAALDAASSAVPLQRTRSSGTAAPGVVLLPLHVGRPPLEALLTAWLAQLQQLPGRSSRRPLQVEVHAMGPPALEAAVQAVCGALNDHSAPYTLHYHRRTQNL